MYVHVITYAFVTSGCEQLEGLAHPSLVHIFPFFATLLEELDKFLCQLTAKSAKIEMVYKNCMCVYFHN